MFSYDEEFARESNKTATLPPGLGEDNEDFNASIICSDQDLLSRVVVRPRVVASIHAFINACVPRTEEILPETWQLCTESETFDCEAIFNYTSMCQRSRQLPKCPTSTHPPPPAPCGLNQMMDHTDGVLMLVGILILGILIGLASTVAVCLIFPKIHSWMLSKVQTKVEISRERSYKTHYSDIDEEKVIRISQQPSNDTTLYSVSNMNSDYMGPAVTDYDSGDGLFTSGSPDQYEKLTRGTGGQVSKKYDALDNEIVEPKLNEGETTVQSPAQYEAVKDNSPTYFILEKT